MAQKFHQKASVQVAIVAGVVAIIVATMNIGFNYCDVKTQNRILEDENKSLKGTTAKAMADIQRLETLLTPFRTIALEKFTGDEKEALRKFADQIARLQIEDEAKTRKIESLQTEFIETKALAQPARLVFTAQQIERSESGYRVLLQFKPTKNERLGRMEFDVSLPDGTNAIIKNIEPANNIATSVQVYISPNGKSARNSFTPLDAGSLTLRLTVSEPTAFLLRGNYLETPLGFEIK
ncbi:MAG: hypothetical protein ABFD90_21115 [Phycisphaerales bacterium]